MGIEFLLGSGKIDVERLHINTLTDVVGVLTSWNTSRIPSRPRSLIVCMTLLKHWLLFRAKAEAHSVLTATIVAAYFSFLYFKFLKSKYHTSIVNALWIFQ